MRGDEFFQGIARRPPFTKLHPRVGGFLKEYFSKEKVIPFGDRFVVNTHFPPFPSPAFDHLLEQLAQLGDAATRRLYCVTLAVTNRCPFNCCLQHLPRRHPVPAFFRIRDEVRRKEVGATELRETYDRVHRDYDEFWLVIASKPTDDLVQKMNWSGRETVYEAGCGTSYATALLASRSARVVAVDLSAAMQT